MKKKFMIIIVAILVIAALIVGYFVLEDLKQEKILIEEIERISKLDITQDEFNTPIKAKGSYAIVEQTIKDYLDDFSTEIKKVLAILENEQLISVLSEENYKEDGPSFEKTKKYLEETRTQFNESWMKIQDLMRKEIMLEKIQEKNVDQQYVVLYESLMLNEEIEKELISQQEQMEEAKEDINYMLDVYDEVIAFLSKNTNKWEIKGNMLQFETDQLLKQYNEYMDKLK